MLSQEVLFRQQAEFFLEEVTEAQAGSYHCCYSSPPWGRGVWSPPSNALELLVTGEVLGAGEEKGHRDGMRKGQEGPRQACTVTQRKERDRQR